MANSGYKGYATLIQIDALTGLPTGITKPNTIGDPNYIPPVYDITACALTDCIDENPVFFISTDEIKEILWTADRILKYGLVPVFQVWIYNENTGIPEITSVPLDANVPFPNTTIYTYHNAGAAGYIVMARAETCTVFVEPPTACIAVAFASTTVLPDAITDVPYSFTIDLAGEQPIAIEDIVIAPAFAWLAVALSIDGTQVEFTGTPTGADEVANIEVSFTLSNCSGANTVAFASPAPPPPPPGSTIFGALFPDGTNAQKVTAANNLGIVTVRFSMILTSFGNTNGMWTAYKNAGFTILLNINYNTASTGTHPFPTNLTLYRTQLNTLFDHFVPDVAVCENEVNNRGYYGTNFIIEDYIAELKVFADVCNQRGILCADGSVPLEFALSVMNGQNNPNVTKLWDATRDEMDGVAGRPYLDFNNLHLSQPGASIAQIVNVANYVRGRNGGRPLINNEWTMLTSPFATITDLNNAVKGWKDGGFIYSVIYDGNGGRGQIVANGSTLTSVGIAYRDAIALP